MIQINYTLFFYSALLLLILPLDWIIAAAIAAVFHELCHILTLYSLSGSMKSIKIQPGGCVIESSRLGEWKQFFSILAGPLGSFSLLLLCRNAPNIAICGFFQGLYNLIPILPLDGGRLLRLLLYSICPKQADKVMVLVAYGICIVLILLAIWFSVTASLGIMPFLFSLLWSIKYLPRKIPCKPMGIGVQ